MAITNARKTLRDEFRPRRRRKRDTGERRCPRFGVGRRPGRGENPLVRGETSGRAGEATEAPPLPPVKKELAARAISYSFLHVHSTATSVTACIANGCG